MGIVFKCILDVNNFLYRKIHKVKVKFKMKGQRSFFPSMHIHEK